MPLAAFKTITDPLKIGVREEMRRLQAYYRSLGCCPRCRVRLRYDALESRERHGAWRIALDERRRPAREVAVCLRCSDAAPVPLATAEAVAW